MSTISRSAIVPYSPAQMFQLVNDVPAYPEFLPWCAAASQHYRDPECVEATIELAKGAVRKRFTTLNRIQPNKMIELRLADGPFKRLEGFWRFDPLDGGRACKVTLDLDFEFSSRVMTLTIGPVFTAVANALVDAFVSRARNVYA
ncbi:MAG: type II toxin-antitoxin system RatA family toxin [Thiotrichales bacterium]